jgi:hypothetical protein
MTQDKRNAVILTKEDVYYFINNNNDEEHRRRPAPINHKKNKYYKLKDRVEKLIHLFNED